jgi:hypothetical protein
MLISLSICAFGYYRGLCPPLKKMTNASLKEEIALVVPEPLLLLIITTGI